MQLIPGAGLLPGAYDAGTRIRSADAAVLSPGVPIALVIGRIEAYVVSDRLVIRPGSRQRTAESRQEG
jgi:hypothetical protein